MVSHLFGTPISSIGASFTGVLMCLDHPDETCSNCIRLPDKTAVLVLGCLPIGRLTIYDAVVADIGDLLVLTLNDATQWHLVDSQRHGLSPKILELCAGCGGMGVGASYMGGQVVVAVDHNDLSTSHLMANNHGQVLKLDILAESAAKSIHRAFDDQPGTTTMGFPCQPFSSQGLQRGTEDSRFMVFYAGLRICFLLQSQSIILECVPAAGDSVEVQQALACIADALGLVCHQAILDLQEVWPSRRRRWWALLLPAHWDCHGLPEWDRCNTFDKVGAVFQRWGTWAEAEENDLQLTFEEFAMYSNLDFGNDKRLLEFKDVAATLLHSYGNALTSCPCLCRNQAFHPNSLRQKGLRGFFVNSQVHSNPRFLHPKEAALLLGIPGTMQFIHAPRHDLALLGLVASPLQMVWVYGHLLQSVQLTFGIGGLPAPAEWLHGFQQELLRQTADLFQGGLPGLRPHINLVDAEGNNFVIASATQCTAAQLLNAQRIVLDWNEAGGITQDGLHLPLHRLLDRSSAPYLITSERGNSERSRPTGLLMIALVHAGQFEVFFLEAGGFLFEILRANNIHDVNFLVDEDGRIYGADFRVWKSMRLTTLLGLWPVRCVLRRGNGPHTSLLGLHEGHIHFALQMILEDLLPEDRPCVISPTDADNLLQGRLTKELLQLSMDFHTTSHRVCCIFAHQGHWALLWGEAHGPDIAWSYCDGLPGLALDAAGLIAGRLNHLLQIEDWDISTLHVIPQHAPHTCGSVAILHLGLCLGLFGIPSAESVLKLHHWLLDLPLTGHRYATGLSADQLTRLENLLHDHGVPQSAVRDRAQLVINKLGVSAIMESLSAKNKWAYLKALASKPSVALRLVQADELSKHVELTAKSKFGAEVSNAKAKKQDKKPSAHVTIDPALLVIRGFQDSEGDEVPQITLNEVEAEAHGIAVCSLAQGQQWLKTTSSISSNPLAILVTETPADDFMKQFNISPMTFTATYTGTGEPVLIYGALKILGDMTVSRVISKSIISTDFVETQVLKLVAFRDELCDAWDKFCQAPVRHLCHTIPQLQLCKGQQCGSDCIKSHCPVDETFDSILLDVWGRSFGLIEGGKTKGPDAELFWVFVRVPQCLVNNLLRINCNGIYVEPRSSDKGHDDAFRVIWLQTRTLDEAQHACRSCIHAVGLVRMKRKYGIRVPAEHEAAAFAILRPDSTYVDARVQRIFRLFPLPHGVQRAGVQKILKNLKWAAKPMQPGPSSSGSMSWQIGAADAPPTDTFTAFEQEVLITELTKEDKPKPPPRYLASSKTHRHMKAEATSSGTATASTETWMQTFGQRDPWLPKLPAAADKPASGKQHIEEVTGKIRDDLKHTFEKRIQEFQESHRGEDPAITQALTESDSRFKKLETSVGEIQAQQQQFSQWFGTIGTQMKSNETAIQTIQYTLSTHQQELTGLHSEIQQVPDQVGKSLQNALSAHKSEVDSDFDKRFARLEALLEKKQKTEHA